jgi:DNA-binding beta-propeller fold protein YncE
VPNEFTLDVLATPAANTGVDPLSFSIPVKLYKTWIYWATQSGNTVGTSDQFGNLITTSGPWPVPDPSGVAFDPDNNWIYIPSQDDNTVCVYDLQGNLMSTGSWPGLSTPTDIAYVNVNGKGRLYVANYGSGSSSAGITAYTAAGKRIALSGSFGGLYSPQSIAYDSNNQSLYVTDNEMGQIFQFDLNGNLINSWTPPSSYNFGGITFAPDYNELFFLDHSNNQVWSMTEAGSFYNPGFTSLNSPNGIVYDTTSGYLYVTNGGDNTIRVYTPGGGEQAWSGYAAGGSNPWGITAVP